jgi:phosphatidate cytidylyltransferase
VVWVGDSAAYYGGRIFGRHTLAPRISPKKTVEGAVAGLAGSVAAGVFLERWLISNERVLSMALICLVAAIAGQIGDLAESALKRSAGVKDSSSLLPGHGGMLDRLDSLLFAAPVFYWFFNV